MKKKMIEQRIEELVAEYGVKGKRGRPRRIKNINELVGYYQPYLERMGKIPWYRPVTVRDLDLSRGAVQAAYKEMDVANPRLSLVDYLCWISLQYIRSLWIQQYDLEKMEPEEAVQKLKDLMIAHKAHGMNFLRLFMKSPRIFYSAVGPGYFSESLKDEIPPEMEGNFKMFFNNIVSTTIIPFTIADDET